MAGKQRHRLADALERARAKAVKEVVNSANLKRPDKELLLRSGYLQEICKGWYLLSRPGQRAGESTAWYASFWDFLSVYLNKRFGKKYCLTAGSSVDIQIGSNLIPCQVTVMASHGGAMVLKLPHNTSVLAYQDPKNLPQTVESVNEVRVMSLPTALVRMPASFYQNRATDAEIALRSVKSSSELIRVILELESPTVAARLAGAYEAMGDHERAREISDAVKSTGMDCVPANPFVRPMPDFGANIRLLSPYAGRIQALFRESRESVAKIFAGLPPEPIHDTEALLEHIEAVYEHDAYNSLSIEGYRVTPELIHKMRAGVWNPDADPDDKQEAAAMAAKGYLEAFKLVEQSVEKVINGASSPTVAENDYQLWYRALFGESVRAGILEPFQLAGHRNGPVYIRSSRHVPPPHTAIDDAMKALFDSMRAEKEPIVQAVLGHWLFGYIHPYKDGNGRVARFLMNLMLVSGGYPWTIVRNIRRKQYLESLEAASTGRDIVPFARFIREEMSVQW